MAAVISGEGLGLYGSSLNTLGERGPANDPVLGRYGNRVYVNAATGNLVVSERDEFIASLGLDVSIARTYNSLGVLDGDNNDNWRLGIHRKLTNIVSGTSIKKVYGDGTEATFNYNSTLGYYVSTAGDGAHDTIRLVSGNWVFSNGDGDVTETYNSSGQLLSIKDSDGNTKTFTYTGNLVTRISDSGGQRVDLTYSGNNLQSITTTSGSVVQTRVVYGYDASDRLISVVVDLTPGNATDNETFETYYTYDGSSKRIASIDHTGGGAPDLSITYDASGRVLTLTDGSGNLTHYAYGATSTTVTDPLLRQSTYHYDAQKRLIKVESPPLTDGGPRLVTEYVYDSSGNVTQVKDPTGAIVAFQYDSRGNLTRQTDPEGNVVEYSYTADNRLARETVYLQADPDYSGMGTISNGSGQPAEPQTTYYVYDSEQHLRFVISPEGRVTENRYFANGTLSATLRYTGNSYSIAPLQTPPTESAMASWAAAANLTKLERTDYQYDFRGQLSRATKFSATDATGAGLSSGASTTHFIYDQRGQLLKSVSPRGGAPAETAATAPGAIQQNLNNHETVYVYDSLGRLISQSDAQGNLTSIDYDDLNNRVSTTLANGLSTVQVYNNSGRLISSIKQDPAPGGATRSEYSLYDAAGQLRVSIDASGAASYYFYDGAGRMVGAIDPEGALTEFTYDGAGRLTQKLSYASKVSQALLDQLAVDPAVLQQIATLAPGTTQTAEGQFNAVDSTTSNTQTAVFSSGTTSQNVALTVASTYSTTTHASGNVNNHALTRSGDQLVQTTGISLAPGTALFNDTTPTEVKATIYRSDGSVYSTVYTQVGVTTTEQILLNTRTPVQPYGYQTSATNDTVSTANQNVTMTVNSTQQYINYTQTSNVANYGWTYSSSSQAIFSNGSGYSLVANSALHNDDTPTSVQAKVYKSDGTFVHTVTLTPGHTGVDWIHHNAYGGGTITYRRWFGATNWNGHVNLGSLGPGNYYAEITTTDTATIGDTTSYPGQDSDSTWTRTNTVNFTIGGGIPDHIDTRFSWPNSITPSGTSTITFRYKAPGSGTWVSKSVGLTGSTRYVDFDHATNGTYTYEITYKDTYGNVLKSTASTFVVNGTTDSSPAATFQYQAYSASATGGASITSFPMTASEAQTINYLEAKVYLAGTSTQVGSTVRTYPAAHANYFATSGQYYVNLRTGSALPNGQYDVKITKHYKTGASASTVTHYMEVGLQPEPTNQNHFWDGVSNWNGQVNLKTGSGGMPLDTYRIDIAVRDDAPNYGNHNGTQLGTTGAPGADGDGTWQRANTVYATIGTRYTTLRWSTASQPQGTVVEFAYRPAGSSDAFTFVPVTENSGQYQVMLDRLTAGSYEYRIRYVNADDTALTMLPTLDLDDLRPATHANDRQIANVYDDAGRLVETAASSEAATDSIYDGTSRLTKTVQDGAITRYFYDNDGRLAGTLNAERYFSANIYDEAGRLVQAVRYDVQVSASLQANGTLAQIESAVQSANTLKTHYFYDGQGRQVGRVNEQGFLQETFYDPQHVYREERQYLTAVTVAAGDTLTSLKSRAGEDEATRFEFDSLGRTIAMTAPDGTQTHYRYNNTGQLVEKIEAAGTTDARITRTRYNIFGDVTGAATVAGADIVNHAWALDANGNLVQTTGLSLAPDNALFNDTTPTEVKATIYRSDGTVYGTVYTPVGSTSTQEIVLNTGAPEQPHGYQASATYDVVTQGTQTVTMTVDSTQQYVPLTTSSNVANYYWTYSSSTQSMVSNSGGYSLVAGSAAHNDDTPTKVEANIYKSDGTFVHKVTMVPGHTSTDWIHHDAYGGGDIVYLRWNGATNWNGHVNLGSLSAGHYYAEITTTDEALNGDTATEPGDDGDNTWTRTNTVNFTIGGGSIPDHIDTRLSWPNSITPAETTSITFRYKAPGSSTWVNKAVGLTGSTRYVDFDHAANGTYTYEIVYKDTYGNPLKITTSTFTVNGANDSTPSATFQYDVHTQSSVYPSGDPVVETITVDSTKQPSASNSSNVANYSWRYSSSTQSIINDGAGFSLVANSALHDDNTPTKVEAKVYKSDGTFVHTVTMTPGHTSTDWVHHDAYGGGDIVYLRWNGATNWNGHVNLGNLEPGDYYAEITTTDEALNGDTATAPGDDGDNTWTRTNTVNFTVGLSYINTRLSWSQDITPADTASVTFRYKPTGSGFWTSKTVVSTVAMRYVDITDLTDGTYDYEIVYKDGSGNTLKSATSTFTVNGESDSTSSASFREYSPVTGSSVTAFPMTTSDAQNIAYLEAKVFQAGTSTQVGATALTYPAAHADYFDVPGQYYVNLNIGSPLPDGQYDVQIIKHYKSGATSTVNSYLEVGLQPELNQRYFWNPANNWNGQVNLKIGSGSMPADTYRIDIFVRDDGSEYGDHNGTPVGSVGTPGADGDGTWQQTTTVYAKLGTSISDAVWDTAIDDFGVRYELDGAGRRIAELHPDGQKTLLYYDRNGRLKYTVNALGEVTATTYNAFGEAESATVYEGRISISGLTGGAITSTLTTRINGIANAAKDSTTEYTYTQAGRVKTVEDAEGFVTTYGYNSRGEQVSEQRTIASGVTVSTHYARDLLGRVTVTTQDQGGIAAQIQTIYDGFGRIKQTVDAMGNDTGYSYTDNGRTITITDPEGRGTRTEYDAYGRVLNVYDGFNQKTGYEYDTDNRRVIVTTPDQVSVTTWKTRTGETLKVEDGNGGVIEYTYTMDGRLATVKDAEGNVTRNMYDNSGRLHETVGGNGTVIRYTYDAANRVIERVLDPTGLNLRTAYQFDGQGRQIKVTEGLGTADAKVTEYVYDRKGQVKQITVDPAGLKLSTRFSYDGLGNTLLVEQGTVASPAQKVTKYTYDKLGRKTREQLDPNGLNITTDYRYDKNGKLTRTINANGHSTWYGYDEAGKLLRTIDGLGGVTRHYYDENGRRVETVRFFTPVSTAGLGDTATGAQDPAVNAQDQKTLYVYDSTGRQRYTLTAVNGADWTVSETLYDDNGNVIETRRYDKHLSNSSVSAMTGSGSTGGVRIADSEVQTALSAVYPGGDFGQTQRTYFAYDANNRLRFTVNALGEVSENVYDAVGNIVEQTLFATAPVLNGNYTAANIDSAVNRAHADNQTTRFVYDRAGRLKQNIDAYNHSEYFDYDALGNKTAYTNKNGAVWNYEYDKAGRLVEETTPAVDVIYGGNTNSALRRLRTEISYDDLGNVTSRTEGIVLLNESGSSVDTSAARTTVYDYDAVGRQTLTIMPGWYDPATGRVEKNSAAGRFQISSKVHYDTLGNAVRNEMRVANNGNSADYINQYKTYDALGRVVHDIDALGNVTTNEYDGVGNLKSVKRSANALTVAVPGNDYWTPGEVQSNLTSSANDRTITFTYDRAGRKTHATQSSVSGNYNADTSVSYSAAPTTRYYYNALGQLTAEESKVNQTEWARTFHFYDKLNRETETVQIFEVDGSGNNKGYATRNIYDAFGNLKQIIEYATAVTMSSVSLTGPQLPTLQTAYNDRRTENEYDRLNRLISVEKSKVYINGSTLTSSMIEVLENTYDNVGNIVAVSDVNGQVTTTEYDALGRIRRVTEPQREVTAANPSDPFKSASKVTVAPMTNYTLDAFGNAVRIVRSAPGAMNGEAVTIQQTFDHIGNLLETTNGLVGSQAGVTRYEYDVAGRVTREYQAASASPNVRLTENRYYYDATGRRLATTAVVTDSTGVKQQSGQRVIYNAFGDITEERRAWGAASVTSLAGLASSVQRSFVYDKLGRVASSQGQDGKTVYFYDLLGNVTREEKRGNESAADGTDTRITETVYDLLSRAKLQRLPAYSGIAVSLSQTVTMLNPVVSQTYDRWGNVLTRTDIVDAGDSSPAVTSYVYNHNNQVLRETLPAVMVYGAGGSDYSLAMTHEIHYNNLGQALREIDKDAPNGTELRSRENTYDAIGRLIASEDASGVRMEYAYDAMGNRIASRNELGTVQVEKYDALGRQIERAVLRRSNGDAYDSFGSATPVKVILNTYDYDAAGRRTAEWSYISTTTGGVTNLNARFAKRYTYNELGHITQSTNETGIVTDYKYDAHGNKIEERSALGHTRKWTYSTGNYAFGRLANSRDIGDVLTSYIYNDFGQLIEENRGSNWEKSYSYHQNGLLRTVTQGYEQSGSYGPSGASTSTSYDYDIRGNRVREIHSYSNTTSGPDFENGGSYTDTVTASFTQLMSYDARNRLSRVKLLGNGDVLEGTTIRAMGEMDLTYKYDEFGNRRHVHTDYKEPGETTTRSNDLWYTYDLEGRVKQEGDITFFYDDAGQRVSEVSYMTGVIPQQGGGAYRTDYTTTYVYNDLGLINLRSERAKTTLTETNTVTSDLVSSYEYSYDLRGFQTGEKKFFGSTLEERTVRSFLNDGRIAWQWVYEEDWTLKSITDYSNIGGYDAAGNLTRYRYQSNEDNYTNTYTYTYTVNHGEYKHNGITVSSTLPNYTNGKTTISFDLFGNLRHTTVDNGRDSGNQLSQTTSSMVYDNDGRIVFNRETRTGTYGSTTMRSYVYVNGNTVGTLDDRGRSSFAQLDTGRKGLQQASTPSQYTVAGGETLQDIARLVYGNSRFWYLIADANGLNYGATEALPSTEAGRPLRIPNVVTNAYNDANTFKPYNPAEIIGDLTPSPIAPPPPKDKSNGFAAIVMIVVAVVVTVYTAGAASGYFAGAANATVTAAAGTTVTTFGTGLAALAGGTAAGVTIGSTAAAIGGAIVGGFAGSLASQAVGKAMGVVDDISLRSAFASGLTAGIGAGVGHALRATDISWLKTATDGTLSTPGKFVTAASTYAGSYVSNKIAGLDASFSWRELAVQAVGSYTGDFLGDKLFGGIDDKYKLVRGTLQGITTATVTGGMNRQWNDGRKLDYAQIAADSFGNALANTIVERAASRPSEPEPVPEPVAESVLSTPVPEPVIETVLPEATAPASLSIDLGGGDESGGVIVEEGFGDINISFGYDEGDFVDLYPLSGYDQFSSPEAFFSGRDLSMPVYSAPEEMSWWDMTKEVLSFSPAAMAYRAVTDAYDHFIASPDAELHRVQALNTALGVGEYLLQPVALARDVFYEIPRAMITGEDANFYSIAGRNLMNGGSREDFYLDIADSSGILSAGSSSYRATSALLDGDYVGAATNAAGLGLMFLGGGGINGSIRFNYAGTGFDGLRSFGSRLFSRPGKLNASPGSINYMSEGDRFSIYASKRSDVDPNGSLDVIGHGTADTFQIESLKGISGVKGIVDSRTGEVDHRLLANIIKNNPEYKGQNIRLLSCSTGSCDVGLAQNLANKLNVTVEAPSDILWATQKGDLFISSSKVVGGVKIPVWPPNGQWRTFVPGGNK